MIKKNSYSYKKNSIDIITSLKDENRFLRGEIKEETEKLKNTIGILYKELEEVKDDNRKLINEIEYYEKTKDKMYLTI